MRGFTLVEMLVVIPIVMIVIGGVITAIISMTGDILSSRASDTLTYDIQDTFAQIRQDVQQSNGFLSINDFTPKPPQGVNDDSTPFTNVGGNQPALILKSVATSANPNQLTSTTIYMANQPNACASSNIAQNEALSVNIVYFVKNNSLWRRVITPSNYQSAGCTVPWQQASCTPAISATFCKTSDEDLLDADNITFSLQYYSGAGSTTPNTDAVDANASAEDRNTALQSTDTVGVTLTAKRQVSGRMLNQSSSMRATRPTVTPVAIPVPGNGSIPPAPVVDATFSPNNGVTFSWQPVSPAATYTVLLRNNSGGYAEMVTGSTATSYTAPIYTRNATISVQVYASTTAGDSSDGDASISIPDWNNFTYQNLWSDFHSSASTEYGGGQYTMTDSGVVVLSGAVQGAVAPSGCPVIAYLPSAYRPSEKLDFPVVTYDNTLTTVHFGAVDVYPDGTICAQNGNNNAGISLNGITFLPASMTSGTNPTYTWHSLTPASPWSNYGSSFATAAYTTDGHNRLFFKGELAGGTTTNSTIFTLPAAAQIYGKISGSFAAKRAIFPIDDSNTYGSVGLGQSKTLDNRRGYDGNTSTSYLSLQGMFLSSSYPGTLTNLSLKTGFSAYSPTTFGTPTYTKADDGIVSLSGAVAGASGATAPTVIATLPAGYRPESRIIFATTSSRTSNTDNFVQLDIRSNGDIVLTTTSTTYQWISLDNISFVAG